MRLIGLILALAALASAQGVDGINVSVSRTVNVAPDQAEFAAVAAVSLDTTQQQVVAALQDLGVSNPVVTATAVGMNSYSYPPPDASQLLFQVAFTAAPSALKDLSKKLDAFRAKLPDGFVSFQYAAALTASQAALDAARQSLLPQLLADARARAQTLAGAAGIRLGPVTGVSESSYSIGGVGAPAYLVSGAVFTSSSSSTNTQYTYFVGVKFATP